MGNIYNIPTEYRFPQLVLQTLKGEYQGKLIKKNMKKNDCMVKKKLVLALKIRVT